MADQLSKFPLAAALVAQTMLERWEQARAEGYKYIVGPMIKNLTEASDLIKHDLYCDDDATKEDESAYKLRLWSDDPGVHAFMDIEWVGVFQLTKNHPIPFPLGGSLEDRVKFIVTNVISDDDEIFNEIQYDEYIDGMTEEELGLACDFVKKNYSIIAAYGGIPFEGDYAAYDALSGPGKDALQKLISFWE